MKISSTRKCLLLLSVAVTQTLIAIEKSHAFQTVSFATVTSRRSGFSSRNDPKVHFQSGIIRPILTIGPPPNTHAMTRFTASATALYSGSLAITGALTALDAFWQNSPYAAAAITCGIKASAADIVAQKRDYRKREEKRRKAEEQAAADIYSSSTQSSGESSATSDDGSTSSKDSVIYNPSSAAADALQISATTESQSQTPMATEKKADWKRNFAFILYGSLYQGVAQEFIYNHLYPVWFGSATSVPVVLTKVLFDLLVQTTLVTLPIAYLTKSVIYRYSFQEALRRYAADIRNHGLLKKYYILWGPVQCITFSVIPEHWRVTFIACVSFFWLIILSTIASKKPVTTKEVAVATSDGSAVAAVAVGEAIDECSLEDGLTCNIDG